jgi:hypothetical protein
VVRGTARDQPDRPAQAPDDLDGYRLGRGNCAERIAAGGEQHQQRQRRPGIGQEQRVDGGGDVIAAHREGAGDEPAEAGGRVGPAQLKDQGGLGHGDVVEHPKAADDDAGQQQAAQRHAAC